MSERKYGIVVCSNCGGKEIVYGWKRRRKFCSVRCSNQFHGKAGTAGGDRASLEAMVSLYGESEGNRKYLERNIKVSNSLSGKPS